MKKLFVIAAVLLAACTAVNAENTTRIGSENRLDFGVYGGSSTQQLGWYGLGFFDVNAANNNLRTRFSLGLAETFLKKGGKYNGINPAVAIDVQYLLPLFDGFYVYPFAGVWGEHYSAKTAHAITNKFGVEGGLGIEIQFSSSFGIFAQGQYQYMFRDNGQYGARAGVVMHF